MKRKDRDQKKVNAILDLVNKCESATSVVKRAWQENHEMFEHGTVFKDKEDWQASFSINKLGSAIRRVQGSLVAILVNNPNWYELESRSLFNPKATQLLEPLKKVFDYHLEKGKFQRMASTFILCSLISMGSCVVGWKEELMQNPRYVLRRTKKQREKLQRKLAGVVENPQNETPLTEQAMIDSFNSAVESLQSQLLGEDSSEPEEKPYIQVGRLDFQIPNHENIYWDWNVPFMEDSKIFAYRTKMNLWQVRQLSKMGFFNSNAKDIQSTKVSDKIAMQDWRYKKTRRAIDEAQEVELLVYFGPLIVGDEVVKDQYHCVIANETVLLKEGDYPFWEPPGHYSPAINHAVRQIPFKATGAGIGETAISMQRTLDANWTLVCDQMRLGVTGLTVVNYTNLVDKGVLEEGIQPGKPIQVRDEPKKAVEHVNLTSNIENQVMPVQEALRQGIQEAVGVNDVAMGAPNLRSRTSAAETNALVSGATENTNSIALELEQNFLIPILEKCLARVLQYGIAEIPNNPELQGLLSEEEQDILLSMNEEERLAALHQYFKFKIRGFSSKGEDADLIQKLNEMIAIYNSGGPLSTTLDPQALMKTWAAAMKLEDKGLLLRDDNPFMQILAENKVLANGTFVQPNEWDDHQKHIEFQGPLAGAPDASPAAQAHVQMHMQMLQMQQAMQAQSQALMGPASQEALPLPR